jgi:pimeloyl-ACP methyl ester carboxylesterase
MRESRKVDVGDAMLEAVTRGTGDTVVLLPAPYHIDYLADFAERLAKAGFRTVAVNWRGIGESQGPLEGINLHHLAADIAGLIETLAAAPAHVVGHAFGNRVARCLAADRPDLVRRVVLLAAGGVVPTAPEAVRAAERLRQASLTESERLELRKIIHLSPASDARLLQQAKQSPVWAAMNAAERVSQATPLADWWEGGSAPLLVVQGLDDRRAPPGNGRALRDQVGERVCLVEIPQAGHFLVLEQPQAVAEAVITFLREPEPERTRDGLPPIANATP